MDEKGFRILPVESAEVPVVQKFIAENFIDMPLYEAFGISEQRTGIPHTTSDPEEPYCLKAIRPDGTIVGVALCDEKISLIVDENSPDEFLKMWDFMKFVFEDSKIYSIPEKTLELRILSVSSKCRGEGVGRRLAEESVNLARSLGYEMVRICCVSVFTEMIAKRLGWEKHYGLKYDDYGKRSGTDVVLKPIPPHQEISYYIKRV